MAPHFLWLIVILSTTIAVLLWNLGIITWWEEKAWHIIDGILLSVTIRDVGLEIIAAISAFALLYKRQIVLGIITLVLLTAAITIYWPSSRQHQPPIQAPPPVASPPLRPPVPEPNVSCPQGQRVEDNRCVLIPCSTGFVRSSNGQCVRPPVSRREPERPSYPAPATPSDNCRTYYAQTVCE